MVYTRPIYSKKSRTWAEPNLSFLNVEEVRDYVIEDNINDFTNCYVNFKRFFIAICFDLIVLFFAFALIAFQKEDKQAFVAFSCLSLSVLVVCLVTLITVKKKIAWMKKSFIQLSSMKNK